MNIDTNTRESSILLNAAETGISIIDTALAVAEEVK